MSDYDRQERVLLKIQKLLAKNDIHVGAGLGGNQPPFLFLTAVREKDVGSVVRLVVEHYPAAVLFEVTKYVPETEERYATADLTIWCKTHEQLYTGMHPELMGHD